MTIDNRRIYCL